MVLVRAYKTIYALSSGEDIRMAEFHVQTKNSYKNSVKSKK